MKITLSEVPEELKAHALSGIERLTVREHQVLQSIVNGCSNKETARSLSLSPRTVEVYRSRAMEKLGLKNAVEVTWVIASLAFGTPTLNSSQTH